MKSRIITLYKNHKNSIGTWKIWYESADDSLVIRIAHSQVAGGAEITVEESVDEGKQGRTILEQTISRMKSRINKQLDKGYVKTREEAKVEPTNTLGLVQPMLAEPLKKVKSIQWHKAIVQPKLDGHRCLIASTEDGVVAYTRQGKQMDTINHIVDEWFDLPLGTILDGELYHHGTKLQTIGSWAKRLQPNTLKLQFIVYDVVKPHPYSQRLEFVSNLFLTRMGELQHSQLISYVELFGPDSQLDVAKQLMMDYRSKGYEGAMVRHGPQPYESGRRSKSLVKLKVFEDGEFRVIGIRESKDSWAILDLVTADGKGFSASAPGTVEEKREVLLNADNYLGRMLTLEFAHWTDDGIPFQPTAVRWRDDI